MAMLLRGDARQALQLMLASRRNPDDVWTRRSQCKHGLSKNHPDKQQVTVAATTTNPPKNAGEIYVCCVSITNHAAGDG
ncbi:hypothetical protein M3I53_35815 [Paraburkholderia sp. CNPSo 3272]|uniref:hypothetical protein n=1 Tax=Paraburkholderia sp. CNPSo 3272 TaxID=2940931 RepID=UPI0020B7DAED|nr:hypothetical protein [Paraburkholderia sp. CNPSo 3272]MCP3728419.1 hypothetical protein [Paraburkholderia sp. CNPSo 3272]